MDFNTESKDIFNGELEDYFNSEIGNYNTISHDYSNFKTTGINFDFLKDKIKPGNIDPKIMDNDLELIIHKEIERQKINGHHINSINHFYKDGIKQIITKLFSITDKFKNERKFTEDEKAINEIEFVVEFTDVELKQPVETVTERGIVIEKPFYPNKARWAEKTYSAELYIGGKVRAIAYLDGGKMNVREEQFKMRRIASIPIMVNSSLCYLNNLSSDARRKLEEDPNDAGGYFIINGVEWCVDNLENLTSNAFHVQKNFYQNEIVRGTFLSKPGDAFENSYQIILRLLNDGAITIEIFVSKDKSIRIPFYMLFKLLGVTSDKDIEEFIIQDDSSEDVRELTIKMKNLLEKGFKAPPGEDFTKLKSPYDIGVLRDYVAILINNSPNKEEASSNENIKKYFREKLDDLFNYKLLPHIGQDKQIFITKAKYLGYMINTLLRVYMDMIESTDRDSYRNKRIHAAGTSIAKTFKTDFNVAVVIAVRKHFKKAFTSTKFKDVKLAENVFGAIKSEDLEKLLIQSITTGNKVINIKQTEVMNRVSSQILNRKNDMNVIATLNIINTANSSASKQNDRADIMRRVHPSAIGYVDVSYSKDTGEGVGMTKQKASTASISIGSSSNNIKKILLEDPDVIKLDDIKPKDITPLGYAKVIVNGDWIGCCLNANDLAYKYRMLRRKAKDYSINPYITIVCEVLVREIKFWTDVGRMLRPLIIVYNNLDEYREACKDGRNNHKQTLVPFKQWINLTSRHIEELYYGKITIENLRDECILEYISPEEHENCYLAMNIEELRKNENNRLMRFTHMDIPQAILSIVTLASPLANHSSAVRTTYFTNHRKQSAGWAMLNWPFRIDKNITMQYYCETPLVRCFGDNISYPNGQNAIIALAIFDGSNQEDSALCNSSSVDCGLFNASYYSSEKVELGEGESFGDFDPTKTMEKKGDANYEKTTNGFIREGITAETNDVLIVKTIKLNKPDKNITHADRSITCKNGPVYIDKVIKPQQTDDKMIAKIKMRSIRHLNVGDKCCFTPEHEIATINGWVPVSEITKSHQILTMEPKNMKNGMGVLIYQNPVELFAFNINEYIASINSSFISARVTLNHKMYCREDRKKYFDFVEAGNITGKYTYHMKTSLGFKGGENLKPEIIKKFAMEFVKCRKDKNGTLPQFDYRKYSSMCNYNIICEFIKLIGGYLVNSTQPINLSQHKIEVASKTFADYLSLMIIGIGYSADIFTQRNNYIIRILDLSEFALIPSEITLEKYNGDVYCFEIPSHLIYVRRNGISFWCSQSSRTGNKGIISKKSDRVDLMYSEEGLIPDLIINSQSIPTRMAMNQIIECALGKLAARSGKLFDYTTFRKIDLEQIIEELKKYGVDYGGKTRMYNGRTGLWIDSLIFIGPTTYQRIQKYVIDDKYAVKMGAKNELTGQPVEGKAKEGGLRIGEMERDCMCGQGTTRTLHEKYHEDSDDAIKYVCRCGRLAVVNKFTSKYMCKHCGERADIAAVRSDKISNVLHHYLGTMDVQLKYGLRPHIIDMDEADYERIKAEKTNNTN